MNINDVSSADIPTCQDRLESIFARQRELMEKYHPIEEKNGLLLSEDVPVDLNCRYGQARLKDFAWRITEELAEAMDAIARENGIGRHAQEEMADALHFLVEMAILSGMGPQDLFPEGRLAGQKDTLDELWYYKKIHDSNLPFRFLNLIKKLGMVTHLLKNKPWKQSHMLTDKDEYKLRLAGVFHAFVDLCKYMDIETSDQIFDLYYRKSEVNKFRQRSQY